MRVIELAQELSVDVEALVSLLRQMGILVADKNATITDGQHDKVLAKVERERRAGRGDPTAAIQAALEEAVGGKVMLLSGVAQTGVEEVLRELYRIIEDDRRAENEEDGERTEFTP